MFDLQYFTKFKITTNSLIERMLEKVQLEKVLFLDIETVPQVYRYSDVDQYAQELFEGKTRFYRRRTKVLKTFMVSVEESMQSLEK